MALGKHLQRELSFREEKLLMTLIGKWAMSVQSNQPLDRGRALEIISRVYTELGLPPPAYFYFAPDLATAYEALYLIVNKSFCLEHFGLYFSPGNRIDPKFIQSKIGGILNSLSSAEDQLSAQIQSRIDNSRVSQRAMFRITEDILDFINFKWGNPNWIPRNRSSSTVINTMDVDLAGSRSMALRHTYVATRPEPPPAEDDFFAESFDLDETDAGFRVAANPRQDGKEVIFVRRPTKFTSMAMEDLKRQLCAQVKEDGELFMKETRLVEKSIDPLKFMLLPSVWLSDAVQITFLGRLLGKIPGNVEYLTKLVSEIPLIAPFSNLCVLVERPQQLSFNLSGLHRDGGPAVCWGNSLTLHALNGIRVPAKVAETPAELMTGEMVLRERNADVRREIVRKIGMERLLNELDAKVLDKQGDYELVLLDLGGREKFPYLKMKNPSVDAWHIEGVSPNISTVKEALNWRNGTKEEPQVLT